MSSSTLQFISQVKLRELRRQRGLLVEAYDQLTKDAAVLPLLERLGKYYHGLRGIKCAGKALHPEVVNLEILLNKTAPSVSVVSLWLRRLEAELASGRLRAEIVYLFGALLGEWGRGVEERQRFQNERTQAQQRLLDDLFRPAQPASHGKLFKDLFAGFGAGLDEVRRKMPERIVHAFEGRSSSVAYLLERLARNIYQPPAVRNEAKRFQENHVLLGEFDDALHMVTREPYAWDWPAEGVSARVLWTRNKWRLYLDLDLAALGILNNLGETWIEIFDRSFSDAPRKLERRARLHKLLDLNAPEVIIENERRMMRNLEETPDLGWYEPRDPWDDSLPDVITGKDDCIAVQRAALQAKLRNYRADAYYQGGAYGGSSPLVELVHAEVQTLRAAFPERPLFVARLDIQDYFPSVPHDVLLALLEGCGLPPRDLQLFERFLAVPYSVDGVKKAQRGVPMDQTLSHFLAELLLRFLERYVHERARVRLLRLVDDVCLLAPSAEELLKGWRAVHEFITACGMQINSEKSGALALGADLPAKLPREHPRWGMLELRADGSWSVHEPTFQAHLDQTRERVRGTTSILARVNLYNSNLRFLTNALGLTIDLGDHHRASLNDALRRFHNEFFEPGQSIVEGLRLTIQERYLHDARLTDLPESWLYWPVTAGGLSLRNVLVLVGQYNEAHQQRQLKRLPVPATRPVEWQYQDKDWSAYYKDLLKTLQPVAPKSTAVMKMLVDDFIARGGEISGGKQTTLSDYWRWILYVYGPEILEKFGTFRFLITELVPLQLIHEQLMHDSSLDETDAGEE